ncbi:hypothetical protein HK096_004257 [Nowakowskiella sp. JEL0078]|nr:hypothetical protein HK096_004257 [Nowakowskiella sp. JEL0078]
MERERVKPPALTNPNRRFSTRGISASVDGSFFRIIRRDDSGKLKAGGGFKSPLYSPTRTEKIFNEVKSNSPLTPVSERVSRYNFSDSHSHRRDNSSHSSYSSSHGHSGSVDGDEQRHTGRSRREKRRSSSLPRPETTDTFGIRTSSHRSCSPSIPFSRIRARTGCAACDRARNPHMYTYLKRSVNDSIPIDTTLNYLDVPSRYADLFASNYSDIVGLRKHKSNPYLMKREKEWGRPSSLPPAPRQSLYLSAPMSETTFSTLPSRLSPTPSARLSAISDVTLRVPSHIVSRKTRSHSDQFTVNRSPTDSNSDKSTTSTNSIPSKSGNHVKFVNTPTPKPRSKPATPKSIPEKTSKRSANVKMPKRPGTSMGRSMFGDEDDDDDDVENVPGRIVLRGGGAGLRRDDSAISIVDTSSNNTNAQMDSENKLGQEVSINLDSKEKEPQNTNSEDGNDPQELVPGLEEKKKLKIEFHNVSVEDEESFEIETNTVEENVIKEVTKTVITQEIVEEIEETITKEINGEEQILLNENIESEIPQEEISISTEFSTEEIVSPNIRSPMIEEEIIDLSEDITESDIPEPKDFVNETIEKAQIDGLEGSEISAIEVVETNIKLPEIVSIFVKDENDESFRRLSISESELNDELRDLAKNSRFSGEFDQMSMFSDTSSFVFGSEYGDEETERAYLLGGNDLPAWRRSRRGMPTPTRRRRVINMQDLTGLATMISTKLSELISLHAKMQTYDTKGELRITKANYINTAREITKLGKGIASAWLPVAKACSDPYLSSRLMTSLAKVETLSAQMRAVTSMKNSDDNDRDADGLVVSSAQNVVENTKQALSDLEAAKMRLDEEDGKENEALESLVKQTS